jgi:hypothetical protein
MSFDPSGRKLDNQPIATLLHRQQDRVRNRRNGLPNSAQRGTLIPPSTQLQKIYREPTRIPECARIFELASSEHSENTMLDAHHHNNIAPLLILGIWAAAFVWFIAWIG